MRRVEVQELANDEWFVQWYDDGARITAVVCGRTTLARTVLTALKMENEDEDIR